mgnify:CR=1 FL=1
MNYDPKVDKPPLIGVFAIPMLIIIAILIGIAIGVAI